MRSPTANTLKNLRDRGFTPWIVEQYNHHSQRRKDLYGFLDVIALHPERKGVLGVQTTTLSGLNARIKKAEALKSYRLWLSCGNLVEFHGWRKLKKDTKKIWVPKIVLVDYSDLF